MTPTRRSATWVAGSAAVVAAVMLLLPVGAAASAVRDVVAASFYFEDAATGSRSEVRVTGGDQVRVLVQDGGRGTRHTVEVDELGVHSGGLSSGDAFVFTVPDVATTQTYRMYCEPHQRRGHVTTLVVEPAGGEPSPTPTPTATAPPDPSPTASPSPTPTSSPRADPTENPTSSAAPSPTSSADEVTQPGPSSSASTDPSAAATGREPSASDGPGVPPSELGPSTDADAAPLPEGVQPGNEDLPWLRGVWLGLLAVLPMGLAAAAVIVSARRGYRSPPHS